MVRLHAPHYGGSGTIEGASFAHLFCQFPFISGAELWWEMTVRMVRMLRYIANEVIQRSGSYFGEIGALSGNGGNKWSLAKRMIDRKMSEAENLEHGKSRLAEIIAVCDAFRKLVSEGCFRTKPSKVSSAWNG